VKVGLDRGGRGDARLQGRRRALRSTTPGYQDFRADASCIVRPQSLIGERYVECEPTQARASGAEAPGRCGRIGTRPGEGQYGCCRSRTPEKVGRPRPAQQHARAAARALSIILNELGAGLAGRGDDLNEVIRRANPALRESTRCCGCSRARTTSSSARRRLRHDHGAARARAQRVSSSIAT
jgi:hypothetical protein